MVDTKKERTKLTKEYDKIAKEFSKANGKKDNKSMKELSDKMRPIGIKLAKLDEIDNARSMVEKWRKRGKGPNSLQMMEAWKNTLKVREGGYK